MIDYKHRYEYINDFKRKKYRRVNLDLTKEYFDSCFEPAVKESGESMTTFIKKAIDMRIQQMHSESQEENHD